MKKFLALLAAATTAITMCAALSACKDDDVEGFKVSDSEWSEYLNINIESYDSVTLIRKSYSNYGKDEAETYGEWYDETDTIKIDNANQIVYSEEVRESYNNDTDESDKFTHYYSEDYYLTYSEAYYHWSDKSVYDYTKAQFISIAEEYSNLCSIFQVYANPMMKEAFTYNADTHTYDLMNVGTQALSIQFFDGGIKLIEQYNSIERVEFIVTGINSTSISVPSSVYTDIQNYIAEKALEN